MERWPSERSLIILKSEKQTPNKDCMLEALRQNWENARHYESARWRYSYYYYGGFLAALLVAFRIGNEVKFFSTNDSVYSLLFTFLSLFFALSGVASFRNLLHSNIEYKNHIRAIEWIARDIGLNEGITEYRITKGETDLERYTYMALPLLQKTLKDFVSFKLLTAILTAC